MDDEARVTIDALCRELDHKRKMIDALMGQSVTLQLTIDAQRADIHRLRQCLLDVQWRVTTPAIKLAIKRALNAEAAK